MAADGITSTDYIKHHLTNLTYGRHGDGSWGFAHSADAIKEMGFWAIQVDSLAWSLLLGLIFIYFFRKAARQATAGVPGGLQNFVEWIVEFIDSSVRGSFSAKNDLVAPMALTIFCWVFLMNLMDLIPVDWLPSAAHAAGIEYLKVVPTTDPNITFGMSLSVFFLVIFFGIKIKGAGGFISELTMNPLNPKDLGQIGRAHV